MSLKKSSFSEKKIKPKSGFSLVELLVVIVLLAIVAALAFPGLIRYYRAYSFEAKGREIEQLIRWAKIYAMRNSINVGLCVEVDRLEIRDLGTNRGAGICSGTPIRTVSSEGFQISGSGVGFDPRGLAIFIGNICLSDNERYYMVCVSYAGIRNVRGVGLCPTSCPNE